MKSLTKQSILKASTRTTQVILANLITLMMMMTKKNQIILNFKVFLVTLLMI